MSDTKTTTTSPSHPVYVVAAQELWNTNDRRYYQRGSVIPLGHLTDEQVTTLVDSGAIHASTVPLSVSELERVKGISSETAKSFAGIGLYSLSEFVKQNPTNLEEQTGSYTVKQINAWQQNARELLNPSKS